MTLWQQPAHLLPVRVRPIGGETVVSYVFRLAAANALARPTTLLRALGDPLGVRPTATMVHNSEVTLNAPALARLETFTGLPAARLCHALPGLSAESAVGGEDLGVSRQVDLVGVIAGGPDPAAVSPADGRGLGAADADLRTAGNAGDAAVAVVAYGCAAEGTERRGGVR
ncbi:TniQ family protein [Rhodococcus aetherivorans]|uniref:TniQ family protein n=1 Tax=Rhodococcus aetherivorans TaxID=191292 RepID=UPI00163B2372|nr:TniQ family protein [Rhodococcus aetherivorans]MBC2586949.1 TniQ family protein [Rhodococcus aetherivorans]